LNPKRAEICGSLLLESASAQAMPGSKNIKFLLLKIERKIEIKRKRKLIGK